jgi:hypothetical protein
MKLNVIPDGYKASWLGISTIESHDYECGYCGNKIASEKGWIANSTYSQAFSFAVYICHRCQKATFFDDYMNQFPGVINGGKVNDVKDEIVDKLYEEARRTTSLNCFTSTVLCCRKILMHIAVSKGAEQNNNFIFYVDFLKEKNYIPLEAHNWVDHIRKKGNEANHEIIIIAKEDALELLSFVEMLLKVIYEFPAKMVKKDIPKETV